MFDEATDESAAGAERPRRGPGEKPCWCAGAEVLKRDIVVHVVELARGFLRGLVLACGDGLSCLAVPRVARTLPAAEHLHAVGDDFGGGALLAFLVLPLAGAQGPFDVDLRALLQVFAGDLGEAAEEHHAVPLGAFLLFSARLVFPGVGGGDRNVGDRPAFWIVTSLGIAPEVAYENHFVYRSHFSSPPRSVFSPCLRRTNQDTPLTGRRLVEARSRHRAPRAGARAARATPPDRSLRAPGRPAPRIRPECAFALPFPTITRQSRFRIQTPRNRRNVRRASLRRPRLRTSPATAWCCTPRAPCRVRPAARSGTPATARSPQGC